jgi:hypothetical protein
MSKLSKELHMFVADQWIQGNAQAPTVHYVWGKPQACQVMVGSKHRNFENLGAHTATKMLQGAGWYSGVAKEAQQVLHDAPVDTVYMEYSRERLDSIFIAVQGPVRIHTGYLEYKKGHSPALFLLAAYRAYQKAEKAKEIARANAKFASTAQRYGARPRKLGDLMPKRGHAKSTLSEAQAEVVVRRDQKLNTLLLHRDLANALEAVNRVLHWGCNERQPPYPETGWKDVPLDKYKQALLRHQSEWLKDPSSLDEESGKLHLAHMATNALILLQRWPEEGKSGSTDH